MEIVWDYEALDDLEVILCYVETQFSMKEARLFRQQVVHITRNLCEFPFLGKVEPLLEDFEEMELRSILVDRLCKLVYAVMNDRVFIIALWDTRRNPKTLEHEAKGRLR